MLSNQQKAAWCRKKLLENMTPSEKRMEQILKQFKVKYIAQKGFTKFNKCFIVDFYLPKYKCVLEIDGGYHFTEKQKTYDLYRENYLRFDRNFCVFRISNDFLASKTDVVMGKLLKKKLKGISRRDKIVLY